MNIIEFNGRKIRIGESWNELSLKHQYIAYQILLTNVTGIFEPHEHLQAKRLLLVQSFLNLTAKEMTDWQAIRKEEYGEDGQMIFFGELQQLSETFNFLWEKVEPEDEDGQEQTETEQYQLSLTLTKCPYRYLDYARKTKKGVRTSSKYYAPANDLENLTFGELATTFSLFESFLESQEEQTANELIATLYRPKKPTNAHNKRSNYEGDIRLPLLKHEATIPKRTKKMAKIPKQTKQLIIFWFACCRHQIISNYPNIFKRKEDIDQNQKNDFGWGGLLLDLAQKDLSKLDNIYQQPYQNAFILLSKLEADRLEQERLNLQRT